MRKNIFTADQIAPCGMNCGVCSGYLAFIHAIPKARGKITHCSGCRARKKRCAYLKGYCEELADGLISFCYECQRFPCKRLQHIDNRYQSTYGASLIHNLEEVRDLGINAFLVNQTDRYLCRKCRKDVISIHNKKCFRCEKITNWRA